jgi:hypothetical protein
MLVIWKQQIPSSPVWAHALFGATPLLDSASGDAAAIRTPEPTIIIFLFADFISQSSTVKLYSMLTLQIGPLRVDFRPMATSCVKRDPGCGLEPTNAGRASWKDARGVASSLCRSHGNVHWLARELRAGSLREVIVVTVVSASSVTDAGCLETAGAGLFFLTTSIICGQSFARER